MIKKIVLDNSVIFKWFAEEEDSDIAYQYFLDCVEGKLIIVIPTLLFYELGRALQKKSIPKERVSEIMELFQTQLKLERIDVGYTMFRKNYENALEYSLSYYDASYVTLMQTYDIPFITADNKSLYRKICEKFANVYLLKNVRSKESN